MRGLRNRRRGSYDQKGGKYAHLCDGYVLAMDAVAIVAQHEIKNSMHVVQWEEQPCDFDALITSTLKVLVEDAAIPRPPAQPRDVRRRSPFGDFR